MEPVVVADPPDLVAEHMRESVNMSEYVLVRSCARVRVFVSRGRERE